MNEEILKAPITDICIIQKGESVPEGYYRLSKTRTNRKADLNYSSGGKHLFLCIKKDVTGSEFPVTNLIVVYPDREEFVPPGFFVVRHGPKACNINLGAGAERIYLCYKKDKYGNPITDIQVILPTKGEEIPNSFNLIDRSATDIVADLNAATGASKIMLCYRQLLPRLDCLTSISDTLQINTRTR